MNLFNLSAKLTLDSDEYNAGLDRAKEVAGKIGKGIGTIFKAGAATIGVATTAVTAFGTQAVKSYANYEQLIGGVEKLYGSAANKLEALANEAYRTAGMSANEYMEMATSFSAALINSLGGDVDKAADMTDVAMKAMSDNVNVFGSDMASVQNAFQGFAKQNYTMLDNLKLGYGGTKTEMERLIKDANEYRRSIGESADLSIDSFADVVQAIQSVQEAQNIAGTTTKEAMRTIEGSAVATKAAWKNVITAIGKGEGLDAALDGLITSVFGDENGGGLLNNIIPRIQGAMEGIGNFIVKVSPILSEKIPQIIDSVLPSLLNSGISLAGSLVSGLVKGLPAAFKTLGKVADSLLAKTWEGVLSLRNVDFSKLGQDLGEALTNLFDSEDSIFMGFLYAGSRLIEYLGQGLMDALSGLIPGLAEIINSISTFMLDNLDDLVAVGLGIISQLAVTLSDPSLLSSLADAAISLITALADGILQALPQLIKAAPVIIANLVTAIIENVPKLLDAAWEIITEIVKGVIDNLPEIFKAAGEIIATLLKGIVELWGKLVEVGGKIIGGLITGLKAKWNDLKESVANIAQSIKDKFKNKIEEAKAWGKDLIKNFVDGIKQKWENLKSTVANVAQSIKDFLGFSEPKLGPLSNFHTYAPDMMKLFAQGIKDNTHLVTDQIKKSFDFGEQIIPVKTSVVSRSTEATATRGDTIYNININQPVESPDEMARGIRVESQYGLIAGGEALG